MDQKEPPLEKIDSVIELYFSGQIQEALDTIETLSEYSPNEPLLFNIRGACYADLGRLNDAVKSYEKAVAIKPDYAEAHYNLGGALHEVNQLNASVKSYERSIAIESENAEAHNNLGNVLRELGHLDSAIKCYKKAVAIKPNYIEAYNNLGISLTELGYPAEAANYHKKILTIKPDHADAYNNLGITFKELGQLDKAINSYEQALAIKPDYAEVHINIGNVHNILDQVDAAVKHYEKAIAIKPDYHEAHNNLGITLMELGKPNHAIKHYEKAIAIKADYTSAHYNLSKLKKYKANDVQITDMQALLSSSNLNQSDYINLNFSLSKVYEDLGNYSEQFKFLNEGNCLCKKELNYFLQEDKDNHLANKKLFSSSIPFIKEYLSDQSSTKRLIFIVGMPRSGTSLVEQIIASHNEVHGAGELDFLSQIISPILKQFSKDDSNTITKEEFLSIRSQYLDKLSTFNVSENVITDKMPLNFENIGFILTAFPEAKIVHLKRDSRAICWSIYKHYFSNMGNGWAYNFDDLAGFYYSYSDLMDFWHEIYPNKIYDISYEDLTKNQEEETKKLLKYCELEWDENCLNFHSNKRAVKTASALQVRQKMYKGSSEAWKKYEAYLKPLIKALSTY